jgi:lipoyl(octanoyl) transferase
MLSTSFGLMSAMRLAPLSWLLALLDPRAADEMALVPGCTTSLLTITPSITYSGSALPNTDVMPRRRTWFPPPGAPEFWTTCAPAIRPASAFSTLGAATCVSCSPETCATSLAALRRDTEVAAPVTTSVSRRSTSRARATASAVSPAASAAVRCWKPMRRTTTVAAPAGRRTAATPRSSVTPPTFVPATTTLAPGTGAPVPASVTRAVTRRVSGWARTGEAAARAAASAGTTAGATRGRITRLLLGAGVDGAARAGRPHRDSAGGCRMCQSCCTRSAGAATAGARARAGLTSAPMPPAPPPRLLVTRLGTTPYAEALELQRAVARARIAGAVPDDVLLLVEHPPVFTLGRSTKASSLPLDAGALRARGVEVFEIERGGDVTFHGPGQLVGYPVVDLKRHRRDLHWYLRQVEEALIRGVAPHGVAAGRHPGYTGVWVGDGDPAGAGDAFVPRRKLASIGVHARDWVTWHGFALNVTPEPLRYFDLVVPCGIAGVDMTAVAREAGREVTVDAVAGDVAGAFADVFGLAAAPLAAGELRAMLAPAAAAAGAASA